MCACILVYAYVYVCMQVPCIKMVPVHAYMYHTYMHIHVYVYVFAYTSLIRRLRRICVACTHIRIYTYMRTHAYTCISGPREDLDGAGHRPRLSGRGAERPSLSKGLQSSNVYLYVAWCVGLAFYGAALHGLTRKLVCLRLAMGHIAAQQNKPTFSYHPLPCQSAPCQWTPLLWE